jgi:hypothetical protein
MFDFLNSGSLEPLIIEGYENIARSGAALATFKSFINPDEITINYQVIADRRTRAGGNSSEGQFIGTAPLDITLKFFIDGTNTAGKTLSKSDGAPATVAEKIQEFYQAVGYSGTQHRTNYVRIKWGRLALMRFDPDVFDGNLKSAQIQYKLFKSDGTPLRAIITAVFTEAISDESAEARDTNSSPDLTHLRRVKEGDTLPALTQEVYGHFKYYLAVASANKLGNFRQLTPGDTLFFPPLAMDAKPKAKP